MSNPISDLPDYLRLFQAYLGGRVYLIFGFTLFAALSESVGILMLLPLLQSLGSGTNASASSGFDGDGLPAQQLSGVSAHLDTLIEYLGFEGSTVAVLLLITGAFLVKGVLTFAAHGFTAYLRGQLLKELKGRLFDAYSRMEYRYYASRDTGHFVNVLHDQINRSLVSFQNVALLGGQLINTLVYVVLAFLVAWRFGLMAVIVGATMLVLFRSLNHFVRELSRDTARESGNLAKMLVQTFHAFKYLTATGQTPKIREAVMDSVNRLTTNEMRKGFAQGFTLSVREPITVVFIMLIVLTQLIFLDQPLAPIMVSIILFHRGLLALLGIQGTWQQALENIGSMELVDEEFRNQDRYQAKAGKQAAPPLATAVSLRDVDFAYDSSIGNVIVGVSLDIPVRKSVALVGDSGAGKSTLVDLLTLLLKPTRGQVVIDGIPGDDIEPGSWRQQIGYVSQETVVFDDSIANNICLWAGVPQLDPELDQRIREAAHQAHIAHFIEGLPDGYETMVGDRGIRLSGGQRQRLFIARELFRKPNLLILDEATSALDSESEQAIQRSIDALKGQITVIIIAHRLSTIRNVDQVFVFDQGRLVEQGEYETLRDAEDSRLGQLVALQAL